MLYKQVRKFIVAKTLIQQLDISYSGETNVSRLERVIDHTEKADKSTRRNDMWKGNRERSKGYFFF